MQDLFIWCSSLEARQFLSRFFIDVQNLGCTADPVNVYLFKVNNGNTRIMYGLCSKLTINTPEQRQWRHSSVFIVNFKQISHNVLVFPSFTLKGQIPVKKAAFILDVFSKIIYWKPLLIGIWSVFYLNKQRYCK